MSRLQRPSHTRGTANKHLWPFGTSSVALEAGTYLEGVIFHRAIPKPAIQTGDPLGTVPVPGGETILGKRFGGEFNDDLKHEIPYTPSMANAEPGTNGRQFFCYDEGCAVV